MSQFDPMGPAGFQQSGTTHDITLEDLNALPEEYWQQQAAAIPLPDSEALETSQYEAPVCFPPALDDSIWAMSFQPPQSYYQPGIFEYGHIQQSQLASSGHPEPDGRPFEGGSQALHFFPQDEQMPGLGSETDSYMHLDNHYDTSNVYMASMPNRNCAPYTHESFVHDSGPSLQPQQLALDPGIINDYLPTSPYLQHSHDHASNNSYLPAPQQSDLQSMPLRLLSHTVPISDQTDLRTFAEPPGADDLGALLHVDYTPIPLVEPGGLFPHSGARHLMTASTASVVPAGLNPFGYDISTPISHTPGHYTAQSTVLTYPSRSHHNLVAGSGRKRALSPTYVAS
jgi:hypothetical protein